MDTKTTMWSITVYEGQFELLKQMPPGIAEWGWQDELCPDTGREHKQGYMRTTAQHRYKGEHPADSVKRLLPGVHIEACGWKNPDKPRLQSWAALKNYCQKKDTRMEGGENVHQINSIPSKYTYAKEVAERLAARPDHKGWSLEQLLTNVKELALLDIMSGRQGIEWIIIDPNWKLMWKETGMATIIRASTQTDRQTAVCVEPVDELISTAEV